MYLQIPRLCNLQTVFKTDCVHISVLVLQRNVQRSIIISGTIQHHHELNIFIDVHSHLNNVEVHKLEV